MRLNLTFGNKNCEMSLIIKATQERSNEKHRKLEKIHREDSLKIVCSFEIVFLVHVLEKCYKV